jgi:hypothetical protein
MASMSPGGRLMRGADVADRVPDAVGVEHATRGDPLAPKSANTWS